MREPKRGDFQLKPFMDSSNLRGAWQIANTVIPYAALWWVADWSLQHAPLLLIPTMVVMVLLLARCFSLMHDCGHDSLFRSRRANQVFGFLLGVISAIPQYPWSRGHAYHHRHNGDWEKYQGPSALVTTGAFAALSPGQQRFYGVLRHPLMLFPGGFFYLVIKPRVALLLGLAGFFPHLLACLRSPQPMGLGQILSSYRSRHWYTQGEFRHLLANNIAVIGSWWLMAHWLGAGVFWSIYAPVMACAAAIFICIFFVQHNFPGSYAHATAGWSEMTGVLEGTSDLELPPLFNWFSADIGCHAIHHLSSKIPNYRLRACHERNAHLLTGVRRLSLADIPGCFSYILWDPQACRLTTIDALRSAAPVPVPPAEGHQEEPMLRQSLSRLEVSTRGEGFDDITGAINRLIAASGLVLGTATIASLHTSCSLTINENADPRVLVDLAAFLRALVPPEGVRSLSGQGERRPWVHDDEGPDDMPAHIRTALTCTSLVLPFQSGRLLLGTWQAVYLWEHRARPHRRSLSLHLLGE